MSLFKNVSTFILVFIVSSIVTMSFARKPAVEDFVGVEHETYQAQAKGTEVLFNFNNSMQATQSNTGSALFTVLFIASFILLPFLMWSGLTNASKKQKKAKSIVRITSYQAPTQTTEQVSNVEYLSDYKKDEKKAS